MKPRRELAKNEIRRLLISECLTNKEIAAHINIHLRSVETDIAEIYDHDNKLIANINSNEQVLTDMNIARERLAAHKQEMLQDMRENYKDTPLKHKVEFWHLICELEMTDMKFSQEAHAIIARRTELPGGPTNHRF